MAERDLVARLFVGQLDLTATQCVDDFFVDSSFGNLRHSLTESVDVASEFAELVGQLGADVGQPLIEHGHVFAHGTCFGVVRRRPFGELADLGVQLVVHSQALADLLELQADVVVAGDCWLIGQLSDPVAQGCELPTQLGLGGDAGIELLQLRGQSVNVGQSLFDVVEFTEALMQRFDTGHALVQMIDLTHSLLEVVDLAHAMADLIEIVDALLHGRDSFECLRIGPGGSGRQRRVRGSLGGRRIGRLDLGAELGDLSFELGDLGRVILETEQPVLESVDLRR